MTATSRPFRIRTARQARRIREGIDWGHAILEARQSGPVLREAVTSSALRAARDARSDLMARAIIRTAYPWAGDPRAR